MKVESINATQLVLSATAESTLETGAVTGAVSTSVKIYFTRQNFDLDFSAIPE
jgi:hypothetical protein